MPPARSSSSHVGLAHLFVSDFLIGGCSSNIKNNTVIIGSHITSLLVPLSFLATLSSTCISLCCLLSQWLKWIVEGQLLSQKTNWKVRMLFFLFQCIILSFAGSRLSIFTVDLKRHPCFTGAHGASCLPEGSLRVCGSMHLHIIFHNELQ